MAFASTDDIADHLELSALSATQTAAATGLLDTATAIICAVLGKDDEAWFALLTATKQDLVKGITVDLVCRAMASPQGLESASESLGAYSRTERYGDPWMTDTEGLFLRRIVYGHGSVSVMIGSHFQEVEDD